MPAAYRSKQRVITVSVTEPGHTPKNFIARTKSGGGIAGNAEKAFLGGMTPQVSIGGDPEREDVTITLAYIDSVRNNLPWFNSVVGFGRVTISEKLNNVGTPNVYTGILDQVNPPEYDASSNDLQELELVVSMDAAMR